MPEFDPRVLDELVVPGGTVNLRDQLYVRRDADPQLENQVLRPSSITTIRGSRQTGKSSLLLRGINHGRNNGYSIINLDLQRVSRDYFVSLDAFLHYLAIFIIRKLSIDTREVDKAWKDVLGPQDKISYLLEEHVLEKSKSSIILAIDEADRLLETPFHTDFFGLIRSWHNSGAFNPIWEKLKIVLAISTEPYLLIADAQQSPFNVGLKLYLEDFDSSQIQFLNQRHGTPISSKDFEQFLFLLNGHPYLTRKALYTLITENLTWKEFSAHAANDRGPFSDHLRRQLWLVRDEPQLQEVLKQMNSKENFTNEDAYFRLERSGLIKKSVDTYEFRCDLYRQYFKEKLR